MIFSAVAKGCGLGGGGGGGGGERTNNATKAGCQVIVTEAC